MSFARLTYLLVILFTASGCGGGGGGGSAPTNGGGSSVEPVVLNDFSQAGANSSVELSSQQVTTSGAANANASLRVSFDQSESLSAVTISTSTGSEAVSIEVNNDNGSLQSVGAVIPTSLSFETVFPETDFTGLTQVASNDGNAAGIFSNALQLDYDHLSFGAWQTTDDGGTSTTASGAFGDATTGASYISITPDNGQSVQFVNATYVGQSVGRIDGTALAETVSDVRLEVDFFQNNMTFETVNTTIISNQTASRRADLDLSGTLTLTGVPAFSGAVTTTNNGFNGTATGQFFGERDTRNAAVGQVALPVEAGGTFQLQAGNANAAEQTYTGAFGSQLLVFGSGQ